jgi:hypothetical protein
MNIIRDKRELFVISFKEHIPEETYNQFIGFNEYLMHINLSLIIKKHRF